MSMTRRTKLALWLGGFSIVVIGVAVRMTFVPHELRATWAVRAKYAAMFDGIRIDDGIDVHEADALAAIYLWEYVSGCGAPSQPILENDTWVSPLRVGVGGTLSGEVVRIDARTGEISSSYGLHFANVASFRRQVLWGLWCRRL